MKKKIKNPKIWTFDVFEGLKKSRFLEPIVFRFCPPTFWCRSTPMYRPISKQWPYPVIIMSKTFWLCDEPHSA